MNTSKDSRNNEFTRMNLNNSFISSLSIDDKRAFALLLKIKAKYSNSRVFDYSISSLSKSINVSRYSVQKYVDTIISNGWGYITNNDQLVMVSFKKIFKGATFKEYSVDIYPNDTINEIVDKINFIILKRNISQQDYVKTFKGYEHYSSIDCNKKKLSLKDYKKLKRVRKNNPSLLRGVFVDFNVIGMRKLAKLLNCSLSSASSFIKRLVKDGLIVISHVKELVKKSVWRSASNETIHQSNKSSFGYYYTHNNNLYRFIGTRVIINMS